MSTCFRLRARLGAGLAVGVLALAGCGTGGSEPDARGSATLTVFAASSLTEAFTEIADLFEADHPGVEVALAFGGSSDLAAQIVQGAPADVFASADPRTMGTVVDADLTGTPPTAFASNTLAIVTPPDNPARITSFADLADSDVALVLCAPVVPCGDAASRAGAAAGLDLAPVSEEQTVKDVLAKVVAGEADAGLVYVTDARAAGDAVRSIALPDTARVRTLSLVTSIVTDRDDLAAAFVDLVLSEAGQDVLAAAGFEPAP